MDKKRKQLLWDVLIFTASVSFAIFIVKIGIIYKFIGSFYDLQWFGVILAGMFFTSAFTTVPSIVVLGTIAKTTPLLVLVILGGMGAMLGDYIIFSFVKDRVSDDVDYLLSFPKNRRFFAIFKTRLFRFFVPFLGALIIASPFPDEIGIAMMGLSKVKKSIFFLLSFIFNGIGIFIIGWLAKTAIGL
jgi:hypothetical protein